MYNNCVSTFMYTVTLTVMSYNMEVFDCLSVCFRMANVSPHLMTSSKPNSRKSAMWLQSTVQLFSLKIRDEIISKCYLFLWNNKIMFAWFIYMINEKNVYARCPFLIQWKIVFWKVIFGIQLFQWLPGDCVALLSGRPSWLRVSPASILPSIQGFSDESKNGLSGNYTFEVIPVSFNGSTVQWYSYWSLKYDVLICFLHYVMILLFFTTERSFHARPMCSRHQQCDIWTYFIGRHVSTGSRGNFLVLKLTLLHIKA